MNEREINLSDLVVEVLLQWRMIVVCMLAGGILLGSVIGYMKLSSAQGERVKQEQELQKAEELWQDSLEEEEPVEFDEMQKADVETVINNEKYLAELKAYADRSVWMRLDAQKFARTVLTFRVRSADAAQSASIEKVYEDSIACGFAQWLVESGKSDSDAAVLNELVSLKRTSNSLILGGDSFSMAVLHKTEDECVRLADQVIAYLASRQEELQETLGAHSLEVVGRAFAYVQDTNVGAGQRDTQNRILSDTQDILQAKAEFSEDAWRYYNLLTTGKEGPPPEAYQKVFDKIAKEKEEAKDKAVPEDIVKMRDQLEALDAAPAPSLFRVKYMFLGMVLAAFLYVFYVFIRYIFNNRLRASDDIKELYGIPQLACIILDGNHKKKPFDFVDRLILKFRNYNKRVFAEQEAVGLAAVAVEIQARREDLRDVYCVGCDISRESGRVAEQIQEKLRQKNISMTVLNNVLYDQGSMERLQDAKGVFLLEKTGETLYEEILKELELLQRQSIKVLGAVVVEGAGR